MLSIATNKPVHRKQILTTLFFVRLLSSVAFAVLFSSLSLYLVDDIKYNPATATDIVGAFIAFNYFLPVIGGYIGDRLINFKNLFVLGHFARGIGCFFLVYIPFYPYVGLSFFLIGSLGSSVSINMLITKLFSTKEIAGRKVAFYWNYAGMNLGFLLGYSIAGQLGLGNHYVYLFWFVSIISVLTAILAYFVLDFKSLKNNAANFRFGVIIISALVVILTLILQYIVFTRLLMLALSIVSLIAVFVLILRPQYKAERKKLTLFFIFMLVSIFFWSIYMIMPTSLLLFIQQDVSNTIAGINIAPQWLANIDPIVIILGSLLLAGIIKVAKNKGKFFIYSSTFFAVGMFFVSIGAVLLAYGAIKDINSTQLSIIWVIIFITALSFGDLFIGPTGYSLIGELVPDSLKGLFMGTWIMTLGIASIIASFISNEFLVPSINHYTIASARYSFAAAFGGIAFITLLIAIGLALFTYRQKSLFGHILVKK